MDKVILTKKGYQELLAEKEDCKTRVRKEIADEIERARQQGDLSENASYKAAMEKKEFNETRIETLDEMLANSIVQDEDASPKGFAQMGSVIEVLDLGTKLKRTYTLVGENEANPLESKISVKSPLGSTLLGKKQNAIVELVTPIGKTKLQIIAIK
jgi:transcription elongation factor GreA